MNYNAAFPNAMASMGCATTCTGYELMNKLDFDSDGDVDANDHGGTYWDNGAGWTPIGISLDPYSGDFKGNGYTVDNLFISRSSSFNGLFGATHANARIETLGVTKYHGQYLQRRSNRKQRRRNRRLLHYWSGVEQQANILRYGFIFPINRSIKLRCLYRWRS